MTGILALKIFILMKLVNVLTLNLQVPSPAVQPKLLAVVRSAKQEYVR
jgi:hypothetical protein